MTASISMVGINSTYFMPGVFVSVNLGAGLSAGVEGPISALLMGNKLSTAPASTDGYIYGPDVEGFTVSSESDVIATFGQGSELHRGFRKFIRTNKQTPVYFLAVTESVGSAATLVATFATTATANGSVRVYVGDDFVDAAVSLGDNATAVGTSVAAAINNKQDWPVTAGASSGVVTLTAKNKGLRGNKIRAALKVRGSGVGTTSSAQNFANMSGGTTADSWTSALATVLPKKYRYIVAACEDATSNGNGGLLAAQVGSQALPTNDIRQRLVLGNVDSIGTANSFAKSLNNPRAEVVWQVNSNLTPFELASAGAAAYSLGESQSVPLLNWDNLGTRPDTKAFWSVSAPFDGSAPSKADINSALISGVSPVAAASNGSSYVVSRVTSYCQDPSTMNLDLRVRDGHIITVMDLGADLIQSACALSFGNKAIADVPAKGAKSPGPGVVTVDIVKSVIQNVIKQMGENGLLDNAAASIAAVEIVRDPIVTSRVSARVQLVPVPVLHQICVNIDQVQSIQ